MDTEWKSLADTWQSQAAPGIDLDAVRTEATRRGRSLRRKLGWEVGFVVLYAAFAAFMVLRAGSDPFERALFAALGSFLVVYQGFVVWMRRRELSDTGLDVQSMIDLELRRSRTTLRYWRVGMWTATALWGALYVVLLVAMAQDWPEKNVFALVGGLLANVVLMPLIGLFGLWRCRQEKARTVQLLDIQDQLRSP